MSHSSRRQRARPAGAPVLLLCSACLTAQSEPPKEPTEPSITGELIDPQRTVTGERRIEIRSVNDGHTVHVPVDENGRFQSATLAPGPYRVRLQVREVSRTMRTKDGAETTYGPPPPKTATWLGEADIDAGQTLVSAGASTRVRVPAPTPTTIEVLVTADGKSVADADVFLFRLHRENEAPCTTSGPRGFMEQNPDDASSYSRSPCVRTDADGRARFVTAGAGRWEFYLRHARGGATTGPRPLTATAGTTVPLALQLPTSTIRGGFRSARNPDHLHVEAQLYRRAMADDSPFTCHDMGTPQGWTVPQVELGADGNFAFAWLPAEAWVVRIVGTRRVGGETILAQRIVTTDGASDIDLGDLARAPTFTVSLAYGVELGAPRANVTQALQVQWLPPDGGPPVFVANDTLSDGRLGLVSMAPGRYRARRLAEEHEAGSWGMIGAPYGAAVEFTVDAAGRPQPPRIF